MNNPLVLVLLGLLALPVLGQAAAQAPCEALYQAYHDDQPGPAPASARPVVLLAERVWPCSLMHDAGPRADVRRLDVAAPGASSLLAYLLDAPPPAAQDHRLYERLDLTLSMAHLLHAAGQFDAAYAVGRDLLAHLPRDPSSDPRLARARAQALHVRSEGALWRCPPPRRGCSLATALAEAHEAAGLFDRAGSARQAGVVRTTQADLLAALGRPEEAVSVLETVAHRARADGHTGLARQAAGRRLHLQRAFGLAAPAPLWQSWKGMVTAIATLALGLLGAFVRRRRQRALRRSGYVDIPDYLEPRRKTRVPARILVNDDRAFHALRLGPLTLIVRIYYRIVHF